VTRVDHPRASVRRIRAAEGRLLRALRIESLTDAPAAFGQTLEEALRRDDAEWDAMATAAASGDDRTWLLAIAPNADGTGRVVGTVTGKRRPDGTLLVFSMWVAPDQRGRGIGRALVDAVERWGRGWGAHRTLLWVFVANEGARRFYETLGFLPETGTDDARAGAGFDAVVLTRTITPGRIGAGRDR
jgi:GNAT superfamily N-acetyltransferase